MKDNTNNTDNNAQSAPQHEQNQNMTNFRQKSRQGSQPLQYRQPYHELKESNLEWTALVFVPGHTKETVQLRLENDQIDITTDALQGPTKGAHLLYNNGLGQAYKFRLRIGSEIDKDAIKAQVRDGVLSVKLPKIAAAQRHKIPIL